jgi:uncharacterized protein
MWPSTLLVALWVVHAADVTRGADEHVTVPDPGTYVVDRAAVFDDAPKQQLEAWLKELEQKTTAQVKVLTVRTTGDEPFFDFVQRHADLWKLGQRGKDNGALVALALEQREARIQTGYGLEGTLPDSWCGTAYRQLGRPQFVKQRYGDGLIAMTLAVANRIADEAGVKLTGIPDVRVQKPESNGNAWFTLLVVLLLIYLWYRLSRSSTRRTGGWTTPYGGGWSSGGWTSSGGGWSSGRGGWTSGGGGSFGDGGSFGGGGGGGKW